MKEIDLTRPQSVRFELEDGWVEARPIGGEWSAAGVCLTFVRRGDVIDALLTAGDAAVLAVAARYGTRFEPGAALFGDAWERGYGDLGWGPIEPERLHHWYMAIDEPAGISAVGSRAHPGSLIAWAADPAGVTLTADTSVGPQGVLLQGRLLRLCELVCEMNARSGDAYDFMCGFMRRLCDGPKPIDGPAYGGNNWYYAYGDSSHSDILADSRFVAEMARGLPTKPYMVIDDGWQLTSGHGGCNGGPWVGNRRFPDMPALAADMKSLGVRPGIWVRPLLTSELMPGGWVRGESGKGRLLDPTHPGVLEYVERTIASLREWGFELIKHDFTTFDLYGLWGMQRRGYRGFSGAPFSDRRRTLAEHVEALYRAIAAGAGGSVLIGCNTIGHFAAGHFEIQRTGDDTSGRCWERTRRMGVNTLAMRMPQHRVFFECDADCAGITGEVDWQLNAQWLELLAHSGTPLFVSADPSTLDEARRAAIRSAFEAASRPLPPARPLDWRDTPSPARWRLDTGERSFDWYEPPRSSYPAEVWWK
ncbi:MAG: hypothetical protein GX558_11570 [Clostridiales bacterium]|nr:hypothetical protein [Clostridiales bacterium]